MQPHAFITRVWIEDRGLERGVNEERKWEWEMATKTGSTAHSLLFGEINNWNARCDNVWVFAAFHSYTIYYTLYACVYQLLQNVITFDSIIYLHDAIHTIHKQSFEMSNQNAIEYTITGTIKAFICIFCCSFSRKNRTHFW